MPVKGSRGRYLSPLIIVLMLAAPAAPSKISLAVFPLVNESDDLLNEWVGYGFAETMARLSRRAGGLQVWDPVLLFRVDSAVYRMHNDTLLEHHRKRWGWNVAVGGAYAVRDDSLVLRIRVVRRTSKDSTLYDSVSCGGTINAFDSLAAASARGILAMTGAGGKASAIVEQHVDKVAYRTFAAGYGMEMRGRINEAMTAYARAEELDARFAEIPCRQGILLQRSAMFDEACEAFERALKSGNDDPLVVAAYANFLADCASSRRTFKFIMHRRQILEQTAEGRKAIGKAHFAAGEYQRAIAALTRGIAQGPSNLDHQFFLGSVFLAAGEYSRAADIFNHLIRYRPRHMQYFASLGSTYRKAGRFMESSQVLESALAIEPDNVTILVDLAHTYFDLGWYERAEQLLYRAREIAPLLADIPLNLGVVHWFQGKKKLARAAFLQASSLPETRQSALNNLGNLLFAEGETGKAIESYRQARKAGPTIGTILFNLATAYQKRGAYRKAARYFDKALQFSPDRIDMLMNRARIALHLKKNADAESAFHRVIELVPDHAEAVKGLAILLMKQKRYREALQPIEEFLDRQPLNREFMLLQAEIYQKMEWYEVALMKYQRMIKEFPEDPSAHLGCGTCMYALIRNKGLQNYEQTILALSKASEFAPGNPLPDLLIGDIYAEYKGYRDLAVENWKKALRKLQADDSKTREVLENKIAGKR